MVFSELELEFRGACRILQASSIFSFSFLLNGLHATGVGREPPATTRVAVEVVVVVLLAVVVVVLPPAVVDWLGLLVGFVEDADELVVGLEISEPSELKSDKAGPV